MARIPVADAHVDVLWRMEEKHIPFYGKTPLAAGADSLRHGGVATQVFALFVSPQLTHGEQMASVLRQIDIFYGHVTTNPLQSADGTHATFGDPLVHPTRWRGDVNAAHAGNRVAGILSLEGGGCLHGDVALLRTLFRLGVRGIGLTWNGANELADGCRESRGAGLTGAGRDVVREAQRLGMWVDLAHLGEAGVADVFQTIDGSVMASHANCRSVHAHPRNLTDDVIREIIRRDGWLGLTFEASFVGAGSVSIEHVFRHLDHALALGAESHIGFGSDFDGVSNEVPGLAQAADYAALADALVDRYGAALTKRILHENFHTFLRRQLPNASSSS